MRFRPAAYNYSAAQFKIRFFFHEERSCTLRDSAARRPIDWAAARAKRSQSADGVAQERIGLWSALFFLTPGAARSFFSAGRKERMGGAATQGKTCKPVQILSLPA
jgi:hypothetical protein